MEGSFAYKGLIGEIIICPEEHDLATRQKMEGYLAHKWGLATKLPARHFYKDVAPQGATTAASVTLTDATVSDADASDPLSQSWELVSKPAGAPAPWFNSITVINPTVSIHSTLATDGSAHGQPKAASNGADRELFFVRRKDHGTSGSVTYSVEFSGDLASFFTNTVEPSFVENSSINADYEVVKVPFPATLPDKTRFGRIVIAPTP